MDIGNILVILILTYYSKYLLTVFFMSKKRTEVIKTNKRLDKLRNKPVKSIKEQIEFINLKKPKMIGRKITWKTIFVVLFHILIFVIFFRIYYYILDLYNIYISVWMGILFLILFPLIINIILHKFNIQKGDLSIILGIRKRGD